MCGTSPVHDDGSDKSMDDDEHHIDHKDQSGSTVTVDNSHYIVAASGELKLTITVIYFIKLIMKNEGFFLCIKYFVHVFFLYHNCPPFFIQKAHFYII